MTELAVLPARLFYRRGFGRGFWLVRLFRHGPAWHVVVAVVVVALIVGAVAIARRGGPPRGPRGGGGGFNGVGGRHDGLRRDQSGRLQIDRELEERNRRGG
jgi:hypothetical protein